MMTYRRKMLFKLVGTAKSMLAGDVGPIEGSRLIACLRWETSDEENPVFNPFVGIDSETDDVVVVGDRSLWAQAFLDEIDRKYAAYDEVLRPGIGADCQALLAVFEPKLLECPACAFILKRMPYDAAGEPSYELCPCCDFLPGLSELESDAEEWRRRWVAAGMPFRHPPPPTGWNPNAQLQRGGLY
jgi:hypothetical protein